MMPITPDVATTSGFDRPSDVGPRDENDEIP
jgi:hypothetical protein